MPQLSLLLRVMCLVLDCISSRLMINSMMGKGLSACMPPHLLDGELLELHSLQGLRTI
jgi:hypothetical protein